MSARIGSVLPPEIRAEFNGRDLGSKSRLGYFLVTADADGYPRPCLLSAGEILAVDECTIRVAIWPDSSTAANLRRGSPVVLCYVTPGAVRYVKGRAVRTWEGRLLSAEIGVEEVAADDHPGFPVIEGIRFRYQGAPEAMTAAWSAQLAALRKVSP